ncbi:copper resistance CopC family protein [Methylocystis parvus]|uniref:copper resistance CopC family protein n=1 Tax=Methylocystis parvus TaxID=134 RepID=UPI003C70DFF1
MKRVTTCALAALALTATQVPAQAHTYLVDSVPAKKQEVMHPLARIKLTFSGKADALFSTVRLVDATGAVVAEKTQETASREMAMPAPELQPGAYRICYRILSADGDIVEGKVDFEVKSEAVGDQTANALESKSAGS